MLFAQGGERGPVDGLTRVGDGDSLDVQAVVHVLKGVRGHGADLFGGGQGIELAEMDAERADADAKLMSEAAECINECLVGERFGDDELALAGPACGAECLEEFRAEILEREAELELHAAEIDLRAAEVTAQVEHGVIKSLRAVLAAGIEVPFGDDEVWDVPFALHAGRAGAGAV